MSDNDLIKRGDVRKMKFADFKTGVDGIYVSALEFIENIKAIPAVPHEMSAMEYLETEARMCRHYGLPCAFDVSGMTVDKAIEIVEKFGREHPEEMR